MDLDFKWEIDGDDFLFGGSYKVHDLAFIMDFHLEIACKVGEYDEMQDLFKRMKEQFIRLELPNRASDLVLIRVRDVGNINKACELANKLAKCKKSSEMFAIFREYNL